MTARHHPALTVPASAVHVCDYGLLLLFLLSAVCSATAAAPDTCTIDPSTHYQTIDHFAASDCWSMLKLTPWKLENKRKIADLLFSRDKGIGLSAWRFNLGGGSQNDRIKDPAKKPETFELAEGKYDWTRSESQRWFLAAAKARGVNTFIAFCNSPPERLTLNGLTLVDKDPRITNNLKPGMEHQFGNYLADILAHFRDDPDPAERINFKWVSPINEPQWDWTDKQEGSRAANNDIIRQYKAVYAELRRQNLTTHILGPESGSIPDMYKPAGASDKYHAAYGNYIDAFCRDPDLAAMMDHTIGYHSYWSDGKGQLLEHRRDLRKKLDEYPDWRAFETEYCVMEKGRDLTMATALRVMGIIHADLTVVNASGWAWWTAVSNVDFKDGLLYTDWHHPGDPENILASKLFWSVGNFSRFIRPGMIRIALHDPDGKTDGLLASAFRDPTNNRIIIVYVNPMDQPATITLKLSTGISNGWTPFITSDKEGDDLREYPPIAAREVATIPGRSVVTLVSRPSGS